MAIENPENMSLESLDRKALYAGTIPSPTSRLGMNLRFYHIEDPNSKLCADVDIGEDVEDMLEDAYEMRYPNKERAKDPTQKQGFQSLTRLAMVTGMQMDLNTWPFALTITASLGEDAPVRAMDAHRQKMVQLIDDIINRGARITRTSKPPKPQSPFH